MKAKQIKDFDNAVASNSTVADVNSKKHTHTGTTNKVQKYNGAGNYSDTQITDNGTSIAIADAITDANVLINIQKAVETVKKIKNTKTNGVAVALQLIADAINTGKNYALKLSANNSTDENVALAVELGKSIFGGSTGDGSAIVEMISTSKGLLIPRMTTTQRNAITTPANGLIVFDTDLNDVYVNAGTTIAPVWFGLKSVGVSGSGIVGAVPRFDGISSIINGTIKDNGSTVAIGTNPDATTLIKTASQLEKTNQNNNTAQTGTGIANENNATGDGTLNVGSKSFAQSKQASGTKAIAICGLTNDVLIAPNVGNNFALIGQAVAEHSTDISIGVHASATGTGAKNVGVWIKSDGGTQNFAIVSETQATAILGGNMVDADQSAILHLNSTTKGFLIPRMTTAQKDAITTPATGLMVFDTTLNSIQINTGTGVSPIWTGVGGSSITGSLTDGKIPRATGTNTLTDGIISDDGVNIGVNSVIDNATKMHVQGSTTNNQAIRGTSTKTNGRSSGVVGLSTGTNPADENVGIDGASYGGNKNVGVRGKVGGNDPDLTTAKNYGGAFIGGNGTVSDGVNVGVSAQSTQNNNNKNIGLEIIVANQSAGGTQIMKVSNGANNTGKSFKVIDADGNVVFAKFVEAIGTISAGQVAIFDADGNIVSDTNLFYNSTTNEFVVSDNSGSTDFSPSFVNLDAENFNTIFQQVVASNTAGNSNIYAIFRSRGSLAVPTAVVLNDTISERQGFTFNGSNWIQTFSELITAGANHTGTNRAIKWEIKTISTATSDTLKTRLSIDEDGHARVKNGNLRIDDGQIGFKTYIHPISTATARTVDFNFGNTHEMDIDTASGTVIITFANMIEGTPYLLNIIQGATPREVNFGQLIRWGGGAGNKPVFSTMSNNDETLLSIVYINGKFIASAVEKHSDASI